MNDGKIPFIVAPMGSGKSTAFIDVLATKLKKYNKSIAFVLPSIALARNTVTSVKDYLNRSKSTNHCGYKIAGDLIDEHVEIVIMTLGYVPTIPENAMIVFDESHSLQPFSTDTLNTAMISKSIFMSATPKSAIYAAYKTNAVMLNLKTNKRYGLIARVEDIHLT